ncbi:sushi, nidogen and EGF-like domain-containing protein 1 isoform X2 [Patiria miniata]|uniref:Fibropellin-1-like n=1 Tax=Patiria miniata TaxID=46514 RepID=A0A914A7C4_PATMI|nr:sushi, nidogen and EGF-like domain-containing protein 1 isoform X2 [Patiria miniata]
MAVREVFTSVLVVLTVFLASRDGAWGRPSGAPTAACTTLTPGHLNNGQPISAQAFASPYVIKVQPTKYTPGQPVTVTIESSFSFRGILLQARSGDTPVGTWQAPIGYQLLQCTNPGDSLTHTSMDLKAGGAQFTWTPPNSATGIIKIMGTIALQKEIFWTGHVAAISPASGVPTADCASEPCVNGLCFQGSPGVHFCSCDSGFEGPTCSSQIYSPYCMDGRVCGMGGTCYQSSTTPGTYFCVCDTMHTGADCMTEITACNPNPCQNSGTCALNGSGFSCTCPTGYTGTMCETVPPPNACDSNPCMNGGVCMASGNTHTCDCPDGFTGANCETQVPPPNACDSNPCMNGGVCTASGNTHTCNCQDGFTGANCETQVDCSPSYPCENQGTCNANGQCMCPTGYTGNRCQTTVTTLPPLLTTAQLTTQIPSLACESDPCQNGGTCRDGTGNSYNCECAGGYQGLNCETAADTCVVGMTCMNGGSCSASSGQICVCAAGFTGTNCEMVTHPFCTDNPCKNGGTCTNDGKCLCKIGYTGHTCITLTTNGNGTNSQTGLPLEIWWIALIALIGLLLIIIAIAVCVTVIRSGDSDQAHIIGNRNAKGYP